PRAILLDPAEPRFWSSRPGRRTEQLDDVAHRLALIERGRCERQSYPAASHNPGRTSRWEDFQRHRTGIGARTVTRIRHSISRGQGFQFRILNIASRFARPLSGADRFSGGTQINTGFPAFTLAMG